MISKRLDQNLRRTVAVVVALVMALTIVPVMGKVHAAEQKEPFVDDNIAQLREMIGDTSETQQDSEEGGAVMSAAAKNCTISFNSKTGVVNIRGSLKGDYFAGVFVDGTMVFGPNDLGKTTINKYININKYAVGYHSIFVFSYKSVENEKVLAARHYVPREVRVRPTNSIKSYSTYYNRLEFNTTSNYVSGHNLYMDYRIKGYSWHRTGALKYPYQTYNIPAKGGCIYQTRLFYGKRVKYAHDGKSYLFTSYRSGRGSKIVTLRTGKRTGPLFKSVVVQSYDVKKRTGIRYGYYTGLPLGKYTYYTYKIRVTVNLRNTAGTPGININGKRFRGNSSRYSFTLGPYSNFSKPRGKTFNVYAFTQYSAVYGGYSPMIKTTVRVR